MKNFFRNPIVAVLLSVLIVLGSTAVTSSIKLNNKCEDIVDGFYYGTRLNGQLMKSVYYNLGDLLELSGEIALVADNYGIDTKALYSSSAELKKSIGYHNEDIDNIYDYYEALYNALFSVVMELSSTQLSQRHLEYMASASEQINAIKLSIENSGYNESVRSFYKKFDRFPVNIFSDIFDIEYPEYFA